MTCIREHRHRVPRWTVNVDAIERARILRGWTVVDLSRIAHVDRGTFRLMVHGARRPTLGTIQAIVTALGLPLSDVIVFHAVSAECQSALLATSYGQSTSAGAEDGYNTVDHVCSTSSDSSTAT
jgi:hypothetical protein